MVKESATNEREHGIIMAKIENLEKGQDRIEQKLDEFIGTADKKYATKEELKEIRQKNIAQDKTLDSLGTRIGKMAKDYGTLVAVIFLIA